jgi:tetratricopeptide (TPR) repeat protein
MVSIRRFLRFVARPLTGRGFSHHGIVGQTLKGRYKILRKLGEGGLGQTFIAEDLDMPEPRPRRVVKQILAEKMNAATQRYFQKEAQALFRLSHPQIPVLQAYSEVEGIPYIVQDFIEGHDLTAEIGHYADVEAVDRARCWTEQDVIIFLMDMLRILDYIHTQKIIHRDIKPSNIMRRQSDDVLVLIDFGIVKNTDDSGGSSRSIAFGTKGYMPLEQGLSNAQFNSDVYALGMTAIQAIIGIPPYYLSIEQRLSLLRRAVNPALFRVISYMVDENYQKRCPSAQEAMSLLQPLLVMDLSSYRSPSRFASQSTSSPTNPPPSTVARTLSAEDFYYLGAKKENDFYGALASYDQAIVLRPNYQVVYFCRGNLKQYKLNDPQGALADYNIVIELDPKNAAAHNNRGNLRRDKLNDYVGALADYDQAIWLRRYSNSKNAAAYYNRGLLKKNKLKDTQGAIADFHSAAEIYRRQNNSECFLMALSELQSLKEPKKVIKSPKPGKNPLMKMLDALTSSPIAFWTTQAGLAVILLLLLSPLIFPDITIHYDIQVHLPFVSGGAYYKRAILKQEKLNDPVGALADYNKAIELDPENAAAHNNRGNLRRDKLNDYAGALADYNKVIEIDSRNADHTFYVSAYYDRAILKQEKLNDPEGALADYNKTIERNPLYTEAYYNRGRLKLYRLKDNRGAIKDFRQAANLDRQFGKTNVLSEAIDHLKELGVRE